MYTLNLYDLVVLKEDDKLFVFSSYSSRNASCSLPQIGSGDVSVTGGGGEGMRGGASDSGRGGRDKRPSSDGKRKEKRKDINKSTKSTTNAVRFRYTHVYMCHTHTFTITCALG